MSLSRSGFPVGETLVVRRQTIGRASVQVPLDATVMILVNKTSVRVMKIGKRCFVNLKPYESLLDEVGNKNTLYMMIIESL